MSAPALGWKRLYGTQTINDRIGVAANVAMKKLVAAFSNGLDITGATSSVSDVCGSPLLGSPICDNNLISAETSALATVSRLAFVLAPKANSQVGVSLEVPPPQV